MNLPARRGRVLWSVLIVVVLLVGVAVLGSSLLSTSAPSGSGPLGAFAFSTGLAAYDPSLGYVVWLLADGSTWTSAHGQWSDITASAGVPANMVSNSQLTYDGRDGYLLLFGGEAPFVPGYPLHYLDNTWAFEQGQWVNLTATVRGAPAPGRVGVMTYDSEDQYVLMFGGAPNTGSRPGNATNVTWMYAGGVWSNSSAPAPPPFASPSGSDPFVGFTDDPTDGYVLYYNSLVSCPGRCSITWTYAGGVWTNRTAAIAPSPYLVLLDAFTFDSTSGTVVAESGCESTAGYTCAHDYGTFSFSAGRWTDVTPTTVSTDREDNGFANDPSNSGVILAGGCCWADFSGLSLGWQDVWVYAHGTWTESEPWGGGNPSWWQNNGVWVSFAIALASVTAVVLAARTEGRPGP